MADELDLERVIYPLRGLVVRRGATVRASGCTRCR
jgi:hypothetical protein